MITIFFLLWFLTFSVAMTMTHNDLYREKNIFSLFFFSFYSFFFFFFSPYVSFFRYCTLSLALYRSHRPRRTCSPALLSLNPSIFSSLSPSAVMHSLASSPPRYISYLNQHRQKCVWRPNFPRGHPFYNYSSSNTLNPLDLLGFVTTQNAIAGLRYFVLLYYLCIGLIQISEVSYSSPI